MDFVTLILAMKYKKTTKAKAKKETHIYCSLWTKCKKKKMCEGPLSLSLLLYQYEGESKGEMWEEVGSMENLGIKTAFI